MCLGCSQRDVKSAMVRIASSGGALSVDFDANLPGRGGYIHRNADCMRKFESSGIKQFRSLKMTIRPEERRRITQWIRTRLDSEAALA
jgi:predicted RNA-binding protein YlxR (DUF448 family)